MSDLETIVPRDFRRKSAFPAKNKSIRRLGVSLSERVLELLYELIESQGHTSLSGAISSCIVSSHKREFPAYKQQQTSGEPQPEKVPKLTQRQQLEHDNRMRCVAYAEALGAEIVTIDNVECARYFTYHMKDRFENTIPLMSLTDAVVDGQYFPSRIKVESFQKSGSVNYDVSNVI